MHFKFIARGTGSAMAAADYLLGGRDAAGQPRAGVEAFRGDLEQVAAVADSLTFEHKYRSVVIALAPEDRPTDAQIEAVPDEFEKTAWAGLEPDRYSLWAAVLHRERGGGVHVHVLTAQCDLETGKSLNIAPPGWQTTLGPPRDAFNHEHGWSRPDDPARARAQQPGHPAYIEAAMLRTGLEHEADPCQLIRDYLTLRVEHSAVRGRADVIAALEDAGLAVPRPGKDYVTARNPDDGKRWRLEGGRSRTLAALTADIEQARETLTEIEETTWGLELREIDGARFVVLPTGTPDRPFCTVGGRPGLTLSSE